MNGKVVINCIFREPQRPYEVLQICQAAYDKALRVIQDMVTRGIFVQNLGGGRSTSYRLTD